MIPETLRYVLGALGGLTLIVVSAVGVLLVKAYQLGSLAQTMETMGKKIDDAVLKIEKTGEKLQAIPVHEQRLVQTEHTIGRNTSDIRELSHAVARLQGREELRSSPDWNGNGSGHDGEE
jgi:hypothetical protein